MVHLVFMELRAWILYQDCSRPSLLVGSCLPAFQTPGYLDACKGDCQVDHGSYSLYDIEP